MSWQPNPQEETTLHKLSNHFNDDIEYAIRAIQEYEGGHDYRMAQYICAFYENDEGETFLDIRHDSNIRNQRDEALSSWDFGMGCYKHKKILIHSPHRTTGYWQRLWSETYMVMKQAEKARMWNQ